MINQSNTNSSLTHEDIIFDFEEFLEKNEERLPEGLDSQYMIYVPVIEKPIRNLLRLPKALINLPLSAILHQNNKTIFTLFGLVLTLSLPSFVLMIFAGFQTDNIIVSELGGEVQFSPQKGGMAISFVIFILLGAGASIAYLKYIYESINSLLMSRKAPWLVDKIRRDFLKNYKIKWNNNAFVFCLISPLALEIPIFLILRAANNGQLPFGFGFFIFVCLLIGHMGIGTLILIMITSFRFVIINTRMYDTLLQSITTRVTGYTEGRESILNKKNYEVVGILSDTPGLSIRSLGDIPVLGLGSGIFNVNAIILIIFSPMLIYPPIGDFWAGIFAAPIDPVSGTSPDPYGLNWIILIGIAVSSIASFGAVIGPLIRITRVMGNFKEKALTELDPFIFDEITGIAVKQDNEISHETQILYIVRNYIYTMKVSPVNPFRLIQIIGLAIIYSSRVLPLIIGVLS